MGDGHIEVSAMPGDRESDGELLQRSLAGVPEAFSLLVQRYANAVFGVALARVETCQNAGDRRRRVQTRAMPSASRPIRPREGRGAGLRISMSDHSAEQRSSTCFCPWLFASNSLNRWSPSSAADHKNIATCASFTLLIRGVQSNHITY